MVALQMVRRCAYVAGSENSTLIGDWMRRLRGDSRTEDTAIQRAKAPYPPPLALLHSVRCVPIQHVSTKHELHALTLVTHVHGVSGGQA